MASTKKPHIAIFSFPFGTHAAPLLHLSRRLASSAPDAIFSFFGTPQSNASLSSILAASSPPLPNLKIHDVSDGVPAGYVPLGVPQEYIELFMKATPGNFVAALEGVVKEKGDVTCVITDSFLWFAGRMTEEMGVPWVAFWTSGACSLAAHCHTALLRSKLGTGPKALTWQDAALDFLPGFSDLRVCDLPEGVVFGSLNSLFSNLLHRMAEESLRATAISLNTFDSLDSTILNDLKSKFSNCLPVGPLSLLSPTPPQPDTHACLAWLDRFENNPATVAYISFGTVMTLPPTELTTLAEGLEASGFPFLWSMKEKAREGLPAGFLERTKERGLVVPWAPQSRVLSHAAVGAFVTHCGWNSVMESITGGVPMICRPFFGDQRLNGRMVSHVWKIGVRMEGRVLNKKDVVGSIEQVLKEEEGKRMRERVRDLKEAAKRAVEDDGSSKKSFNVLLGIITSS